MVQAAIVAQWWAARLVPGFHRSRHAEDAAAALIFLTRWPVLRVLGISPAKGDHFDEFDAVALGRHRDTDDWLAPVTG